MSGERAKSGSDLGVEDLFRAHARFVASFLYRLGVDRADIEDQVQEVFLIAHRKGGYVPGPAAPTTWLAAIASRVASHYRRSRRRRRESLDDGLDETTGARALSPEGALEVSRGIERVQRALETLDDEHRATFVLVEIERFSCVEAARALEIPVGTVYSRLHKARQRFREAHGRLFESPLPKVKEAGG